MSFCFLTFSLLTNVCHSSLLIKLKNTKKGRYGCPVVGRLMRRIYYRPKASHARHVLSEISELCMISEVPPCGVLLPTGVPEAAHYCTGLLKAPMIAAVMETAGWSSTTPCSTCQESTVCSLQGLGQQVMHGRLLEHSSKHSLTSPPPSHPRRGHRLATLAACASIIC